MSGDLHFLVVKYGVFFFFFCGIPPPKDKLTAPLVKRKCFNVGPTTKTMKIENVNSSSFTLTGLVDSHIEIRPQVENPSSNDESSLMQDSDILKKDSQMTYETRGQLHVETSLSISKDSNIENVSPYDHT